MLHARPRQRHLAIGSLGAAVAAGACLVVVGGIGPPASAVHDVGARPGRGEHLPVLRGRVGPGFRITIDHETVEAGRYRLKVRDRSTIHNFHFFGPGVDRTTSVEGTGRTTWRVDLVPGTYLAVCVPHGSMKVELQVT